MKELEYYSFITTKKTAEAYMSFSYDDYITAVGKFDDMRKLKIQEDNKKETNSSYQNWAYSHYIRVSTLKEIIDNCNIKEECILKVYGDKKYGYIPKTIANEVLKKAMNYSEVYETNIHSYTTYDNTIIDKFNDVKFKLYDILNECSKSETELKLIDLIDTENMIESSRFGIVNLNIQNLKYRILDISKASRRTRYSYGRYNMDDAEYAYNSIIKTLNEYKVKSGEVVDTYYKCNLNETLKENIINYTGKPGYDSIKEIIAKCIKLNVKGFNTYHSRIVFYDKFDKNKYLYSINNLLKNHPYLNEFSEKLKQLKLPNDGEFYDLDVWKSTSGFYDILDEMETKANDYIHNNGNEKREILYKLNEEKLLSNLYKLYPKYKGYKPYELSCCKWSTKKQLEFNTILYKEL